ncbi:MAG: glycosyl hydrolase [Candidatus Cyclobacteriaceae bacterium M3_2C_046]
MKKLNYFLALTVITILWQCQPQQIENSVRPKHSFTYLQEHFHDPDKAYSTGPLWVWNDVVTKEKIDTQLEAFQKQNILQVFIHPRPGLISEYLSEEWFELSRYTLEKGKELGMNIWIYDENSFPSGFGGGHVQAEMPESYTEGSSIGIRRGKEIKPDRMQDYLIVLRQSGNAFEKIEELPATVTDQYFAFEVLNEKMSGWYGGFSYVDLLIPGVTEKFIEVTMAGYEEVMGKAFGTSIPGVFTDEPNISPRGPEKGVKFSPVLFPEFEKRWGYDLKMHLPALFAKVGDYKKVRYHYYRLLLELFIDRWSKPWYEYTESKNLKWTGHYWEHGWPSPHHGGDNMAMYAWHQIPGIDMLFNTFDLRPDQFGNVRAVKELSSVANQLGRERTLSETYGGAGWELTFQDMKRLGDWEYTLGVNFLNQHLSYMTLKGRRKGDFPQSFLTHAPYWEDYGILAKYFARLSLALSRGQQINNTLILEPTTTAWMYYSPTAAQTKMDEIEEGFRQLVDGMEKRQLEYDLGAENIIKDHGSVNGSQFIVGERAYDYLILPPYFENIDDTTWRLLQQYVKNGGKVFSFSVPTFLNGVATEDMAILAGSSENWVEISSLDQPEVLIALEEVDFQVDNPLNINGKVFHMRRQLEDGQLVFWSNFNREESETIQFAISGKSVKALDPLTGEIKDHFTRIENGKVNIKFDLPASGSKLFFIAAEEGNSEAKDIPANRESWQVVTTETSQVKPTALNSLTIDYLDLEVQGSTFNNIYFSMAADSAYKLNGLEQYGRSGYNPWAVAVQYKTNIVDMGEKFGINSGFTATYHFEIAPNFQPEQLHAVVEWSEIYQVSVNGEAIQPVPDKQWLDHSWDVFDITDLVEPGPNQLTLSISPMHIHAEIEPVYLLGDFNLQSKAAGFLLNPPTELEIGSWKDQGWPFYSQSMQYRKNLEVETDTQYKIKLNHWHGTVARVLVNDQQVGIIGWPPFEFNLTDHLQTGSQSVTVEVVGSLKNQLGPHHNVNRRGIVTPWSWFFGPDQMPAGSAYDMLDYGLFHDFDILQNRADGSVAEGLN